MQVKVGCALIRRKLHGYTMQVSKDEESKTKTYTCMFLMQPRCRSTINSGHHVQPTHHETPARAVPGWKYRPNKILMEISLGPVGRYHRYTNQDNKSKGKVIKKSSNWFDTRNARFLKLRTSNYVLHTELKSNPSVKSQPAATFTKQGSDVTRVTSDWGSNFTSHSAQ